MAYINAEKTDKFRKEIKAAFPDFKFSVTNEHHSTICISIMEAPIQMLDEGKTYEDVNTYYIKDHYKDKPAICEVLEKIHEICYRGNHNNSDLMTDYFDVGWYISITIGKWDKPFKYVPKQEKPQIEAPKAEAGIVHIVDYSEKAIVVIGNTYPVRGKMRDMGGKFNKYLSCGPGWVFSKSKLEELKTALS